MSDLIDRLINFKDVEDIVRFECGELQGVSGRIIEKLKALPPAQPERKNGHWLRTGRMNVYGGFEVECSVCNDRVMITNIEYEHYCRNCGARMDEEEVSE